MPKSSENKRKTPKTLEFSVFGGDKRDRTADLLNAIQALSQLSYTPILFIRSVRLLYYSILAKIVNSFFILFRKISVSQSEEECRSCESVRCSTIMFWPEQPEWRWRCRSEVGRFTCGHPLSSQWFFSVFTCFFQKTIIPHGRTTFLWQMFFQLL